MAHWLARAATMLAAVALLMLPTAALGDSEHDHASPSPDPHSGHTEDHSDLAPPETDPDPHAGHTDHGTAAEQPAEPGGHDGHNQLPATVTPEVRTLVLSGFAGINAAVVVGAWLARRGRADPDPRKRTPKAAS